MAEETAGVDVETFHRIKNFLMLEAQLLDDRRFDDWFELMTDDVRYVVPVRSTQDVEGDNPADEFIKLHHINDNHFRLEQRIKRLETGYAWSEKPPTRTRHYVSNVRVLEEDADEYSVRSNLLLYLSRGGSEEYTVLSGERDDVLRQAQGHLRLARRTVFLDNTSLPLDSISVFI